MHGLLHLINRPGSNVYHTGEIIVIELMRIGVKLLVDRREDAPDRVIVTHLSKRQYQQDDICLHGDTGEDEINQAIKERIDNITL